MDDYQAVGDHVLFGDARKRIIFERQVDEITTMKLVALIGIMVLLPVASWAATRANDGKLSSRNSALIEPFLGDFLGSLNTAETPSPYDDLNHNPCGGPDGPPCRDEYDNPTLHLSPLANVIFRVSRNSDGKIQAAIFQTTQQYRNNTPIDLIGEHCESSIGELAEYDFTSNDGEVTVANLSFPIHPGKCGARLGYSLGSNFELKITRKAGEEKASQLEVRLYRGSENQNRTFVKRDNGETYEVRMKFEPRKYDEFERDYFHRNYEFCPVDENGELISDSKDCFTRTPERWEMVLPTTTGFPFFMWDTVQDPKVRVKKHPRKKVYHEGTFYRYQPDL
jgi:hypothetical protein